MGAGFRDGIGNFVTDDIFGESVNATGYNMEKASRSRRKHKKRNKRIKKSHSRRVKKRTRVKRKGRRKGMSASFLRNLRKKHHLGEFKRR